MIRRNLRKSLGTSITQFQLVQGLTLVRRARSGRTPFVRLNQPGGLSQKSFFGRVYSSERALRCHIAHKLGNLRINRITFRTLRHWKAILEYHRTKDILHVMQMLGHKNIKNTLIYTHLAKELFKGEHEFGPLVRFLIWLAMR